MPGTRFIAFKVPLKKSFEGKLAPEERFSPLDLFNRIQEQNEELGLIIDLTYTHRYYKPEDLPETIPYLKIFTVGHQVPDDETILKFKSAVNGFLKENKDNDKLIGVHCTHGLNRTGYLICRYLIDVEGMRPDDAIELFNRCRGHCLERQNYIEDLQKGPVRKNWDSSVSRSSGFENSTRMMEPIYTRNRPVKRGPAYNLHWNQGYPLASQHFHTHTQDLQQSVRFCFKDIFTESEYSPEKLHSSSWSPWRGLFTKSVLLECKARCQSNLTEEKVVFCQLWTILSHLWMD
ncbi:RNA/RNP complex-1-interacting phosphatase isoform X5 [Erinaceus europaeus]|nr:RNA/RNP complex-1-interacting phosphatase isoform X5 [Erinaceus europaeus]XP_060043068.1 RNA/RNP complex-1-interacting phosphatase isoform X5 [Erinaceus europaeus]